MIEISIPMDLTLARKLLEIEAVNATTLTYSEFAHALGVQQVPIIRTCTNILEELVREDVEHSRPILAALVVQKGSASIPRRGFFDVLTSLGCYQGDEVGPEAINWHQQELKKLKKYYERSGK